MNRIYCAVGKIVELSQDLEQMVADICKNSEIIKEFGRNHHMSADDLAQAQDDAEYLRQKMQTMTFGAMIGVVYDSKSLSHDEISSLKALLEKRNYFVHEYFKLTKFGALPKEDFIAEEFGALKDFLGKLKKMQNRLQIILDGQLERLDFLTAKI